MTEPVVYINRLTIRNRLGRLAWGTVSATIFRYSPTPFHGWRRWLLRQFGATIDRGAHPYPTARVWAPWNLTMGEHSCLAAGVDCYNVSRIEIGAFAVVSQRTFLCAATHDHTDPAFPLVSKPISIAARAWVAAEAFVGPGVTIGEGAVVGARAVAVKDVPPWAIVVGNPAHVIGERRMKNNQTEAEL